MNLTHTPTATLRTPSTGFLLTRPAPACCPRRRNVQYSQAEKNFQARRE